MYRSSQNKPRIDVVEVAIFGKGLESEAVIAERIEVVIDIFAVEAVYIVEMGKPVVGFGVVRKLPWFDSAVLMPGNLGRLDVPCHLNDSEEQNSVRRSCGIFCIHRLGPVPNRIRNRLRVCQAETALQSSPHMKERKSTIYHACRHYVDHRHSRCSTSDCTGRKNGSRSSCFFGFCA